MAIRAFLASCAVIVLLSTTAAAASAEWRSDQIAVRAVEFARHVKIDDPSAVEAALGVDLKMRPYCDKAVCKEVVFGQARQFPDPPALLPGPAALTALYYAARVRPQFGVMAALDLFVPHRDPCVTRAALRGALGREDFQGSRLGLGEPGGVGLNYVVRREPSFRVLTEFVFSGPVAADGCLAFVQLRQDSFGAPAAQYGDNKVGLLALHDLAVYDEDDYQATEPRDVLSPLAGSSPLGLTLDAFREQFSACTLDRKTAEEEVSPLTDASPPAIPLLPVLRGTYLATEHSVWNTNRHGSRRAIAGRDLVMPYPNWTTTQGSSRVPALDATLITSYSVQCRVRNPHSTMEWNKYVIQSYQVLVYQDQILAVKNPVQRSGLHSPAGMTAAEVSAVAESGAAVLAQVPYQTPYGDEQTAIMGYAEGINSINVVRVLGPAPEHNTNLVDPTTISNASIDRRLWQDYAVQIRSKLSKIDAGLPALQVAEPIEPAGRTTASKPLASQELLLSKLKSFLSGADLLDYAAFGGAMGQRSVLLGDGFIVDAVSDIAPSPYIVGLTPGHSLLDGLPFNYTIYPWDTPDSEHRLPPYHRKVAELDIGFFNHPLQDFVCITRAELGAAFGVNQPANPARSPGYVHKQQSKSHPSDTIYVTFSFNAVGAPDGICAQTLAWSQYRHVTE